MCFSGKPSGEDVSCLLPEVKIVPMSRLRSGWPRCFDAARGECGCPFLRVNKLPSHPFTLSRLRESQLCVPIIAPRAESQCTCTNLCERLQLTSM
jgi:hypothetical protein